MAIGSSRVPDLASLFANIYEDAVFAVREQSMATRLVRVFTNGRGDQTRDNPEYASITASSVAETEDFSNPTRFSKASLATLTPGEIMAQVLLTDRRIDTDPDNARADASTELGAALATKIDTDILGNASSLTGGTIGGLGSAATWGQFYASLSILRGSNVPPPYVAVYHPYAYHAMGTAVAADAGVSQTNSPWLQDAVMQNFWMGRVAQVDIFISSNAQTSGGTAAYNMMFSRDAVAFDLRRDIRQEPQRDASARAWELNVTSLYAHGVWRPAFGVQILTAANTPTG